MTNLSVGPKCKKLLIIRDSRRSCEIHGLCALMFHKEDLSARRSRFASVCNVMLFVEVMRMSKSAIIPDRDLEVKRKKLLCFMSHCELSPPPTCYSGIVGVVYLLSL